MCEPQLGSKTKILCVCVVKAQLKLTLKLDEDDADDEKKCIPMKWNQFSTELHSYDIKPLI